MEYRLDISNSYPRFLIFSSEQGFTTYISTPNLDVSNNGKIEIIFDNIEVNFLEDIWYSSVVNKNPNSIVNYFLKKVDLNDLSSILTLNLKRAKVIINDIKSFYMKAECNGEIYYHDQNCSFNVGDKRIWLGGMSMDFLNTIISAEFIFSGGVDFIFDEADIFLKSIDFNEFIGVDDICYIDQAQEKMVKLKGRNEFDLDVNGKKSNFLDFYYSQQYFSGNEDCTLAIKDYSSVD